MADRDWGTPQHALTAAKRLMGSTLQEILPALSAVLDGLVRHEAVVMLSGDCPFSPVLGHGELAGRVTAAELTAVATRVDVGRPWVGEASVAGEVRPVLAVASAPRGSAGALLAVVSPDVPAEATGLVQLLWDLAVMRIIELLPAAEPIGPAGPWIADSERARVAATVGEAHATTLTTLVGILRTGALDDSAARRMATGYALSALVDLRAEKADERSQAAETADDAFGRLADMLGLLSRYGGVAVEFSVLDNGQRLLPADVAHAARIVTRGIVLTMIEQGDVERMRVSWHVEDTGLRMVVRDDGLGELSLDVLTARRLTDRVTAMGGSLHVDAVPTWGTVVTAGLPLAAPGVPVGGEPLSGLNARELDVLEHLMHGHRNRVIAEQLDISEHTVKFHVAKILKKLGVKTRGEAAAIAHSAGLRVTQP